MSQAYTLRAKEYKSRYLSHLRLSVINRTLQIQEQVTLQAPYIKPLLCVVNLKCSYCISFFLFEISLPQKLFYHFVCLLCIVHSIRLNLHPSCLYILIPCPTTIVYPCSIQAFKFVPVVRVKTLNRLVSYTYHQVDVNVVSYISGQTLRLSPVFMLFE